MKITETVIKMTLPTFYNKDWSLHEVTPVVRYERKSRKSIFYGNKVEELWINGKTSEQKGVERRLREFRMKPRIIDKYNPGYTG